MRHRLKDALSTSCLSALLIAVPWAVHAATPSHRVTPPPPDGAVDYQLGGAYPPAPEVAIVDRDRSARPVRGRYNICYVNAFQTQPDEVAFWQQRHPDLLLRRDGALVTDPGWPGEYLLDTSTPAKRSAIAAIEKPWLAGCAGAGFSAVEPDNLDSWTRSRGRLTEAGNVALATALVAAAHRDGLAVAQKNTPQLGAAGRRTVHFDFAVAEECQVYGECGRYTSVYGREVIEIEYTDNGRAAFAAACRSRHGRISIVLRDRDVTPRGDPAYVDVTC